MTTESPSQGKSGALERRTLGRTGEKLSIIGLGGMLVMGMEQSASDRIVHESIDRGVNYFDVSPTYGDAEERLGRALVGRRDNVFLAAKTIRRTESEAAVELRETLKRLRTDHVDLYQLHGLTTMDELDRVLGAGGAMEAFLEARETGLVRFIGFSAHSVEVAMAAMDRFQFDSILFPVNFVLYYKINFGPQVLERAREKGVGCLAIKAMARTLWKEGARREYPKCWYEPFSDASEASLALRFALSESVVAAVPPGEERLFRMALDAAERFTPLADDERKLLEERSRALEPIFGP